MGQNDGGVQLETAEARLLLELVGPEPGILVSELEKLAIYAGENTRIDRKDILKLVGAGRVETILEDPRCGVLAGQARLAAEHFVETLIAGGEEPVLLLAAMSASLLQAALCRPLRLRTRIDIDEACRLAGMPSFAVEKTRKQHAHLGPSRVDQLPATLKRADLDLKGGSTLSPRIVLETFLIRLALPRAD